MESFDEVWERVAESLSIQMSEVVFQAWIKPIRPVEFGAEGAVLAVKTPFQKTLLESRYIPAIQIAMKDVLGFEVPIKLIADEKEPSFTAKLNPYDGSLVSSSAPEPVMAQVSASVPAASQTTSAALREYQKDKSENFTFENFIVGSSNKFAHAASIAVATKPAEAYNPLLIYGNTGLGKTHLLKAISNEILRNNPSAVVVYMRCENFTNELLSAIQTGSTGDFRAKYREADILLIDDIQFIGGKTRTQEEFFHTFNDLYESKRQIVLSSDRPPKEINTLEDRLRTRFEWGLIADIQPPDLETRIAILAKKAEATDIRISPNVLEFLAGRLQGNIRQLEGIVLKLKAYSILENSTVSLRIAQEAVRDFMSDGMEVPVSVSKIVEETSRFFNISVSDIMGRRRTADVSAARQIAIYITRKLTGMSTLSIGVEFGRDHSTVLHSIESAEKSIASDQRVRAAVEEITRNVTAV